MLQLLMNLRANLKLAIPVVVFCVVRTAVQRCTSLIRFFVHESIYDLVKEKMVSAYKQVKVGDHLDQTNLMGPLIDQASVVNFSKTVEQTVNQGGKSLTKTSFFVEPTIIEANADMPIVAEENFCPILYIMPF